MSAVVALGRNEGNEIDRMTNEKPPVPLAGITPAARTMQNAQYQISSFDNIAAELRELDRWALWRREPRFAGESPTKIPYDSKTLRRARSNDPTTWASFSATRAMLEKHRQRFTGLGFMLGIDAPFCGIDSDDCRDVSTGLILPRAQKIIDRFNTYTEISPSGCGVKMIVIGTMPTPDGAGKNYRRDPWGTGTGGIEMYRRGRFFALTGNRLEGTPTTVEHRTEELARLYRELYPPAPPRPTYRGPLILDDANIERCTAYMAHLPASVSGQGGHDRLLHAACIALRFGLTDSAALDVLHQFNLRAVPPWNDRDIERKLAEAHKLIGNQFGSMLADRADFRSQHRHPRWRIVATIGGAE